MSLKGGAESYTELKGAMSLPKAIQGKSAYEIALLNGFEGTEAEWLESLTEQTRANAADVIAAAEQSITEMEAKGAAERASIEESGAEALSDIAEAKATMLNEIELAAEIVQTTGDSETAVMSQKAATDELNHLSEEIVPLRYGKIEYAVNPINGVESSSTGDVSSSNTRLLIQSKLQSNEPIEVKVNGMKVYPHFWRKTDEGFAYSLQGSHWYNEDFVLTEPDFYFDFVVAKADDSNITPSECAVSITTKRLLTMADGVKFEKAIAKTENRVDTLFEFAGMNEAKWSEVGNKCLAIANGIININAPTDSTSLFRYAVVACRTGDKFIVNGIHGTSNARAWAFVSDDGTVLRACESTNVLPKTMLTAPAGSKYAVFNDTDNGTVLIGTSVTCESQNLIQFTNTKNRDILEDGNVALRVSFPDESTIIINGTSVKEHPLYLNGATYLDSEIFAAGDYFFSKFTTGDATSELSLRLCDIDRSDLKPVPSGTRLHFGVAQRGSLTIPIGTYTNYKTQLMFVRGVTEPKIYVPYGQNTVNDAVARETAEAEANLNEWQANVIARSEQICRLTYLTAEDGFPYPPATKPNISDLPTKGTKITGLPYSSSRTGAKLVGVDARFDTYLSCVVDPNSVLYKKYVDPISSGGARAYYGQVCSSVVGYSLNLKHYMSTGVMKNWNGVRKINPQDIEVGDIVLSASGTVRNGNTPAKTDAGHVTVITGVRKDKYGRIKKVRWCEGTIPVSKFHPWEDFDKFLDTENGAIGGGAVGGLKNRDCLYRLTNRNEIPYDKMGAINCFDETDNLKINVPAVICNYGHKAVIPNTETDIALDVVEDILSATLTYSNGTTKTYGSASAGTILEVLSDVPSGRHSIECVTSNGATHYSDFIVIDLSGCSYNEGTKVLTTPNSATTYDLKLWEVNAMDSNGGHQKIINVEGLPASVDCTSLYVLNDGNPQSFIYTDVAHEFVSVKAIFRIERNGDFYGNVTWEHPLENPAVEIKPAKKPIKALIRALRDSGTITEEQFRLIDSQID